MKVLTWKDVAGKKIETFPYRGENLEVKGVNIRWLSNVGSDGAGNAEYGLRYFTVEPGGFIPIHKHFYSQTMYILKGTFECWAFDIDTDEKTETVLCPPDSSIFLESMEPHGMKNVSDELGVFLCCIANVYEDKACDCL